MAMAKSRKALFDRYDTDIEKAKKLNNQMNDCYAKLIELYKDRVTLTNDKIVNGNLIIEYFLKSEKEQAERINKRIDTRTRLANEFRAIFNQSLSRYYNPVLGFDITGFDSRVIKSPDGESVGEAIARLYGDRARTIVRELLELL